MVSPFSHPTVRAAIERVTLVEDERGLNDEI